MSMKVEREFQVGDYVSFETVNKSGRVFLLGQISEFLKQAIGSIFYKVIEVEHKEEYKLLPHQMQLVTRAKTEHKARPKDERIILDETQVFLDFVELEKLSISQLQDLREKELQRIAENEKLKNQIISDILSLRNIETNADFRRKRT